MEERQTDRQRLREREREKQRHIKGGGKQWVFSFRMKIIGYKSRIT